MDASAIPVLLIEDNPGDACLIEELLDEVTAVSYHIEVADSLAAGIERIARVPVRAVLLDLSLPDSQGLDTLTRFLSLTSNLPVIVLTGLEDERLALQAVHEGAQDYLVKGRVDGWQLSRALRYAIERETLRSELQAKNREIQITNQELEAFTYSVSHDLRGPLHLIMSFAEILTTDCAADLHDDAKHYLSLISANAKELSKLLEALLSLSRLHRQPLTKQPVAMQELVEQVVADLPPMEGRTLEIAIRDLPVCDADPVLIKQVWINLIANAVKFTRKRAVARVQIGYGQEKQEGVFFVRDNGVGFDMQYADKLFGVFQRLHPEDEYEGSGAGLAIVQRIIRRHGGRVWADAAVDRGATFYFTLC